MSQRDCHGSRERARPRHRRYEASPRRPSWGRFVPSMSWSGAFAGAMAIALRHGEFAVRRNFGSVIVRFGIPSVVVFDSDSVQLLTSGVEPPPRLLASRLAWIVC